MFAIKRNQVVIAALVVMIVVAGYLSYIDRTPSTDAEGNEIALTNSGEVEALIVDGASGQEVPVVSLSNTSSINTNSNLVSPGDTTSSDIFDENIDIALSTGENPANDADNTGDAATEPGEAVFVNSSSDSSFFIQAKLEREQGRSKQREMLTEMIKSDNLEKDKKAECADKLLEIQDRIEKETAAEAMIEAKGFSEVYVRIDDETVDVVVSKKTLSDSEIAQIEDIIKRKTGMGVDQIRISPLNQ